jgi:hypothetical protein
MTPKQKARELFFKFHKVESAQGVCYITIHEAKECTNIYVNEIKSELENFDRTDGYVQKRLDFYEDVIKEIDNL